MNDFLSSAAAGMLARVVCHPLDTSKTVTFTGMASHEPAGGMASKGAVRPFFTLSSVVQNEGVAGLYRGVGIATVGAAPGVALYLTTYTRANEFLTGVLERNFSNGESSSKQRLPASLTALNHLLCGFIAEAVSCIVWVPMDVTKERMQSQPSSLRGRYTSSWNALTTVYRNESFRGMYKGYLSTLASYGPFSAIYFATYEKAREYMRTPSREDLTGSRADQRSISPGSTVMYSFEDLYGTFATEMVAGGIGNMVASIITNPLELVKTRVQVQRAVLNVDGRPTPTKGFNYHYDGLCDGLRSVVRDEGWRSLWRGCGSRMAFTVPNAALTMALYDWIRRQWV